MSERGEAKAKKDTLASGAKPRLEERVREQGWRPTPGRDTVETRPEAARPRAIEGGRQRGATHHATGAEAECGGRRMTLTLLTRDCCHLCDEMLGALKPIVAMRGATLAVVDVDAEPGLALSFGDRVPVLFLGDPRSGSELCHFRLDRARVEAALAGVAAPAIEVASEAKIR